MRELAGLVSEMLNIYGVPFTDPTSREVAVTTWAQQFAALLAVSGESHEEHRDVRRVPARTAPGRAAAAAPATTERRPTDDQLAAIGPPTVHLYPVRGGASDGDAAVTDAANAAVESVAYLSRLLRSWAPQVEPLPDLLGLCTQIDNYVVGLRAALLAAGKPQQIHESRSTDGDVQVSAHSVAAPDKIGRDFDPGIGAQVLRDGGDGSRGLSSARQPGSEPGDSLSTRAAGAGPLPSALVQQARYAAKTTHLSRSLSVFIEALADEVERLQRAAGEVPQQPEVPDPRPDDWRVMLGLEDDAGALPNPAHRVAAFLRHYAWRIRKHERWDIPETMASAYEGAANLLDRYVAQIEGAAGAVPARSAWQPIETAPKDGTLILGALIHSGKVWRVHEMKHNGLAFYTSAAGSLPVMTHWMPLPAGPPEASPSPPRSETEDEESSA